MEFTRDYGVATTINIPLVKAAGGILAAADWTPVAGDVKVSKDGAAAANIATLPVFVTDVGWDFDLSAAEMQAARVDVRLTAAVTEATLPDGLNIITLNDPSAMFGTNVIKDSVNDAAATATGFTTTTNQGAKVLYGVVELTSGTTSGESRIAKWTGTTLTILGDPDMDAAEKQFSAAPANGVTFTFRRIA